MASSPNKFLQRIRKRIVKSKRAYEVSPTNQRKDGHRSDVHLKEFCQNPGSSHIRVRGRGSLDNAHLHTETDKSICTDKQSGQSLRGEDTLYCFQKGVCVSPKIRTNSGPSRMEENYVYAHKELMDNEAVHTNLMNDQGTTQGSPGCKSKVEYGTPRHSRHQLPEKEQSTLDAINCTPTGHRKRNAKHDPLPVITTVTDMNNDNSCFNGIIGRQTVNDNEGPIPMIDDDLEDDVSGYSSLEPSSPDSESKSRSTSQSSSDQSMKSRTVSESSGTCSSSNSMREISSLESPSEPSKLTGIQENEKESSDVFEAAPPAKLKLQPHQLNIPRLVPLSQRKKNKLNSRKHDSNMDNEKPGANIMTQSMIETESTSSREFAVPLTEHKSKDDSCLSEAYKTSLENDKSSDKNMNNTVDKEKNVLVEKPIPNVSVPNKNKVDDSQKRKTTETVTTVQIHYDIEPAPKIPEPRSKGHSKPSKLPNEQTRSVGSSLITSEPCKVKPQVTSVNGHGIEEKHDKKMAEPVRPPRKKTKEDSPPTFPVPQLPPKKKKVPTATLR